MHTAFWRNVTSLNSFFGRVKEPQQVGKRAAEHILFILFASCMETFCQRKRFVKLGKALVHPQRR
jgi:hypothetical protein